MLLLSLVLIRASFTMAQSSGLTGNWAVKTPRNDGTVSKVYFDLKQDGQKITGTIRSTQFYYTISESSGGPDGFTITGK